MSTRLGISLGLDDGPLGDALELCRHAEQLGYTDVWSAEVAGTDGLATLAALAPSTSSIRMGTAILPVFTRPPALLAMGAVTLHDLTGGRFVLGLGTSSAIIVERWMGGRFDRPLMRLRETVAVVRAMLGGDKVSIDGETTRVHDFRLQHPPVEVPIYLAALGPVACRLAGEVADGVILFLKSPAGVEQALGWVAEGARRAGRDPSALDCVIRLPVVVGEIDERSLDAARRIVVSYAMVDVYNRSLSAQGFGGEAEAIAGAWSKGDRSAAVAAVSDPMLRQLIVMGGGAEVTARIEAFRAAGANTPVLLPLSFAPDRAGRHAEAAATIDALAPP